MIREISMLEQTQLGLSRDNTADTSAGKVSTEEMAGMNNIHKAIIMLRSQKHAKARRFLLETVAYIVFLAVFSATTYNFRSSWEYFATNSVKRILLLGVDGSYDLPFEEGVGINFKTAGSVKGYYRWLNETFLPAVLSTTSDFACGVQGQSVFQAGARIGPVRLRQLRVKEGTGCRNFKSESCYGPWSKGEEDTSPFGPRGKYTYSTEAALCNQKSGLFCTATVFGVRADQKYPLSRGFVLELPEDLAKARALLGDLIADNWISEATRAVMVEFNLFNANINVFVSALLMMEQYATGSLATQGSILSLKQVTLDEGPNRAELVWELILVVLIVLFMSKETQEFYTYKSVPRDRCTRCCIDRMKETSVVANVTCPTCEFVYNPLNSEFCPCCQRERDGNHNCWRGYFQDYWNFFEVLNQALFITIFALRLKIRSAIMDFDVGEGTFYNLYPVCMWGSLTYSLLSLNAVLCYIQSFKYFGKFKALSTLVRTLGRASNEIFYFIVVFLFIFMGFALSFHFAFGNDIVRYSHWIDSSASLFRMLLGDFDYFALQESNRVLAPLFFASFVVVVILVLSNVFIAIICTSFEATIQDLKHQNNSFLSSALRLFTLKWKAKFEERFFKRSNPIEGATSLLKRLLIGNITPLQAFEVRCLVRELEHLDNPYPICHRIIKVLKARESFDQSDFFHVKEAVITQRKIDFLERYKEQAFTDDKYEKYLQELAEIDRSGTSVHNLSSEDTIDRTAERSEKEVHALLVAAQVKLETELAELVAAVEKLLAPREGSEVEYGPLDDMGAASDEVQEVPRPAKRRFSDAFSMFDAPLPVQ